MILMTWELRHVVHLRKDYNSFQSELACACMARCILHKRSLVLAIPSIDCLNYLGIKACSTFTRRLEVLPVWTRMRVHGKMYTSHEMTTKERVILGPTAPSHKTSFIYFEHNNYEISPRRAYLLAVQQFVRKNFLIIMKKHARKRAAWEFQKQASVWTVAH